MLAVLDAAPAAAARQGQRLPRDFDPRLARECSPYAVGQRIVEVQDPSADGAIEMRVLLTDRLVCGGVGARDVDARDQPELLEADQSAMDRREPDSGTPPARLDEDVVRTEMPPLPDATDDVEHERVVLRETGARA